MKRLVERVGDQLVPACKGRDGIGRGHQHRIREAPRARLERTLEQPREGQHVVDALAVGGEGGALLARHERLDLRIRVRQRENHLTLPHPLRPDEALDAGRGDHDVRALHERLERHALPARGDEPRHGVRIAVGAEHALHAIGTQQAHDAAAGGSEADLPDGAVAQVDIRAP